MKVTMHISKVAHRFATVFGLCVITVSLFSGCATHVRPEQVPVSTRDLNYFQVDCRIKEQQIAFLQSLRQTNQAQAEARFRLMLQPWQAYSDPQAYAINADMAYGNHNKYINHHLNLLKYCP